MVDCLVAWFVGWIVVGCFVVGWLVVACLDVSVVCLCWLFGVLLLGCLYVWFVGWLVGLFLAGGLWVDCLVVWLFACLLLCCLVVRLFDGLVAWLVCCFDFSLD